MEFPRTQHGVIYCDPPWAYEMYGKDGYEKSPQAHYDCMTDAQLRELRDDVLFATAHNAVCFMWAVWPKISFALELMRNWGFEYKTGGAWHKRSRRFEHGMEDPKTAIGTGYILRSACEPFLIGTVGKPRIKNHATRNIIEDNVIEEAVREHSRKPDCTANIITALFDGPYLEMFARAPRDGWTIWGNQTDRFAEEPAPVIQAAGLGSVAWAEGIDDEDTPPKRGAIL